MRTYLLPLLAIVVLQALAATIMAGEASRSRAIHFHYNATVSELPVGAKVRVWLPVPQDSDGQQVETVEQQLPVTGQLTTESQYGNRMLYFESTAPANGLLSFKTSYLIHRNEYLGLAKQQPKAKLSKELRNRFLSETSKVPITGPQLTLLEDITFPTDAQAIARTLYDRVDHHVRYDKSRPGYGNGDVRWVCDSRFGNCTDFHSLFISWARAKGLPAKFEIGFPLPAKRGSGTVSGYHCWAFFLDDEDRWVPVDISEADKHPETKDYNFGNLTENRIGFTTGRDIDLVPKQNGPPLNYFIYPYVEVDSTPWPVGRIETDFSYQDVTAE